MTSRAVNAHGVILRLRPFGDTSVVVHWLTAEHGRIGTAARGARGPRSPFRGKLDLFYSADFSFRCGRAELHALGEVAVTDPHPALRRDFQSLRLLAYVVAGIEQTTESGTPIPEVFELFVGLVGFVERHGAPPRCVLAWELRLLAVLGLEPDTDTLDPKSAALLRGLLAGQWESLLALTPDGASVRLVSRFLHGFWMCQFGRLPKGRGDALGLGAVRTG